MQFILECDSKSLYMSKMDSLADEGVMMYFLETPDFPLLSKECDANYVLNSFIFGDYKKKTNTQVVSSNKRKISLSVLIDFFR